jgi:serine/threonine protein kinase
LGETIGEGGFGLVKKATHLPTGETVAVKICKTISLSPDQLHAIEKEIEVQRSLFHENIAQIYEVIHSKSTIYIVMEYCQNGELFDYINRRGPLPEKEAAEIFHQILSALIYLRHQKISHRDVKPENILFHKNGKVKLIDFGFSCYSSQD